MHRIPSITAKPGTGHTMRITIINDFIRLNRTRFVRTRRTVDQRFVWSVDRWLMCAAGWLYSLRKRKRFRAREMINCRVIFSCACGVWPFLIRKYRTNENRMQSIWRVITMVVRFVFLELRLLYYTYSHHDANQIKRFLAPPIGTTFFIIMISKFKCNGFFFFSPHSLLLFDVYRRGSE